MQGFRLAAISDVEKTKLRHTVFVLISAHAPISAHPGRFRKKNALAHTGRLAYWYVIHFLHKNAVFTSLKLNRIWSNTILKRLEHLSGIIIDYFDMSIVSVNVLLVRSVRLLERYFVSIT